MLRAGQDVHELADVVAAPIAHGLGVEGHQERREEPLLLLVSQRRDGLPRGQVDPGVIALVLERLGEPVAHEHLQRRPPAIDVREPARRDPLDRRGPREQPGDDEIDQRPRVVLVRREPHPFRVQIVRLLRVLRHQFALDLVELLAALVERLVQLQRILVVVVVGRVEALERQ